MVSPGFYEIGPQIMFGLEEYMRAVVILLDATLTKKLFLESLAHFKIAKMKEFKKLFDNEVNKQAAAGGAMSATVAASQVMWYKMHKELVTSKKFDIAHGGDPTWWKTNPPAPVVGVSVPEPLPPVATYPWGPAANAALKAIIGWNDSNTLGGAFPNVYWEFKQRIDPYFFWTARTDNAWAVWKNSHGGAVPFFARGDMAISAAAPAVAGFIAKDCKRKQIYWGTRLDLISSHQEWMKIKILCWHDVLPLEVRDKLLMKDTNAKQCGPSCGTQPTGGVGNRHLDVSSQPQGPPPAGHAGAPSAYLGPLKYRGIPCYCCLNKILMSGGTHPRSSHCEHLEDICELCLHAGLAGPDYEKSVEAYFMVHDNHQGVAPGAGTGHVQTSQGMLSRAQFEEWRILMVSPVPPWASHADDSCPGGGKRYSGVAYRHACPGCNLLKSNNQYMRFGWKPPADDAEWRDMVETMGGYPTICYNYATNTTVDCNPGMPHANYYMDSEEIEAVLRGLAGLHDKRGSTYSTPTDAAAAAAAAGHPRNQGPTPQVPYVKGGSFSAAWRKECDMPPIPRTGGGYANWSGVSDWSTRTVPERLDWVYDRMIGNDQSMANTTLYYAAKAINDLHGWSATVGFADPTGTNPPYSRAQMRTMCCEIAMDILDKRIDDKIKVHYQGVLGMPGNWLALITPPLQDPADWRSHAYIELSGAAGGGGKAPALKKKGKISHIQKGGKALKDTILGLLNEDIIAANFYIIGMNLYQENRDATIQVFIDSLRLKSPVLLSFIRKEELVTKILITFGKPEETPLREFLEKLGHEIFSGDVAKRWVAGEEIRDAAPENGDWMPVSVRPTVPDRPADAISTLTKIIHDISAGRPPGGEHEELVERVNNIINLGPPAGTMHQQSHEAATSILRKKIKRFYEITNSLNSPIIFDIFNTEPPPAAVVDELNSRDWDIINRRVSDLNTKNPDEIAAGRPRHYIYKVIHDLADSRRHRESERRMRGDRRPLTPDLGERCQRYLNSCASGEGRPPLVNEIVRAKKFTARALAHEMQLYGITGQPLRDPTWFKYVGENIKKDGLVAEVGEETQILREVLDECIKEMEQVNLDEPDPNASWTLYHCPEQNPAAEEPAAEDQMVSMAAEEPAAEEGQGFGLFGNSADAGHSLGFRAEMYSPPRWRDWLPDDERAAMAAEGRGIGNDPAEHDDDLLPKDLTPIKLTRSDFSPSAGPGWTPPEDQRPAKKHLPARSPRAPLLTMPWSPSRAGREPSASALTTPEIWSPSQNTAADSQPVSQPTTASQAPLNSTVGLDASGSQPSLGPSLQSEPGTAPLSPDNVARSLSFNSPDRKGGGRRKKLTKKKSTKKILRRKKSKRKSLKKSKRKSLKKSKRKSKRKSLKKSKRILKKSNKRNSKK